MKNILWWFVSALAFAHSPELDRADSWLMQRSEREPVEKALAAYRNLESKNPMDPEIQWRLAAASHFLGYRHLEGEEKIQTYEAGIRAARFALGESESCAPCHFWLAIGIASLAEARGIFSMLGSLGEVKEHLKQVVFRDELYAMAGGHRLLGLIHWKVPGIFGGSNAQARVHFERAVEIAPYALNILQLAEFLEAEESVEVGRAILTKFPQRPSNEEPENLQAEKDLRERLSMTE